MLQKLSVLRSCKAHKRYEFGCKVAVVTTTQTNWIVAIEAHHGNPYDGATLKPALVQVERLAGLKPQQAILNQGFRGVEHHPEDVDVRICDITQAHGQAQTPAKASQWY